MRVTSDRAAGCVTLSHRLEARNNRTQLAQDGGAARFCLFHRFQPALGIRGGDPVCGCETACVRRSSFIKDLIFKIKPDPRHYTGLSTGVTPSLGSYYGMG